MESVQEQGVSPSPPLPVLLHDLGNLTDFAQTQHSIASQALNTVAMEDLRHYRCFKTPQGWVLALDPASWQTFLWRTQDGKRIQLPPKKHGFPKHCKCLLSNTPDTASGCTVVVFDLNDYEMWVCKIGATDWDNHRYHPPVFIKGSVVRTMNIGSKCHGIRAVGGRIYFETSYYELGGIELNGKEGLRLGIIDAGVFGDEARLWDY